MRISDIAGFRASGPAAAASVNGSSTCRASAVREPKPSPTALPGIPFEYLSGTLVVWRISRYPTQRGTS